jgi:hypothetical protein
MSRGQNPEERPVVGALATKAREKRPGELRCPTGVRLVFFATPKVDDWGTYSFPEIQRNT